ncbi:MAG: hypothetical protein Q8N12_06800 [Thermodesulfovibrionales bacterium]|nr:hypothetical protein [Thermodesulfovibrionales bacterium]
MDLDVKTIGREIEQFLSVTGRVYWEKLIKKVDASGGIFYKEYLLRRNPFIEGFRQYFHLYSRAKSIWKNRSEEIDYLTQKIFIINKIIRNVNDRGQAQIIGRLRGGDIRSFLHEITIATHFLRNGFEVNFVEYERPEDEGRTFDFLVSRDSIEAEVECKSKSYDAGRKIKRDGFYILCDELFRQFKSTKMKCLLEINCSENLGQNHDIFIGIAKKIKVAIGNGDKNIIFSEDFSITINYLPPETLIDSEGKFASVIRPYWTPKSHFAIVSNNEMTMIIKVESEENDRVLKAMYDELKSSL